MHKDTTFTFGDYYDSFINEQIKAGKYSSAGEVVRAALRLFEHEESKKEELLKALKEGEKSGFIKDFDKHNFLADIHKKHINE